MERLWDDFRRAGNHKTHSNMLCKLVKSKVKSKMSKVTNVSNKDGNNAHMRTEKFHEKANIIQKLTDMLHQTQCLFFFITMYSEKLKKTQTINLCLEP